ncbi:hypothetical protein ACLI1A_06535 [Flavobacterium sp. RHBU_3]|uniref:hypothetical protein n=1 Tax=Flavobacterium sp. RHBU_3 TaxID=3391184 RepID=UPI0039849B3C
MITTLKISCKKATGLIDKRQLVSLTVSETIQLRIHTTICSICRRYEKQSAWIEQAVKHLQEQKPKDLKLSETARNTILEKIIEKK